MYKICFFCVLSSGCAATIEPGHRGLLFDPRGTGLQHDVLGPGRHLTGVYGRIDDFDVTYSTRREEISTTSSEGLQLGLRLAVIYRPIISELYELDTEIGPNYYDEVVGPEFRSAARGVFARHGYGDLHRQNELLENEIEADLRRRTAGKHVEIASITLEDVHYAPEIAEAVRAKLVGEQEAVRQKAQLEADALRRKLELSQKGEEEKMRAEAELRQKQNEMALAKEQIALDKLRVEAEALTKVAKAKAEAEEITVLAKARAEEKRSEAAALTPLAVQLHAYDALAKLGGSGTTVLLGDPSKLPQWWLTPHLTGPKP